MNETQLSFKRYEKKYLLSREKYGQLWRGLEPRLEPDRFFESTVLSLYYDWDDFRLIRSSIEQPVYKEKLRLRSYNVPGAEDQVFVELKKKYKGIVYKRRVRMREREAEEYLAGGGSPLAADQISREIDWFLKTNPVRPKVLIACDRRAYVGREEPGLRLTFDSSIRWRDTQLSLTAGDFGQELLEEGQVLMEIKMPESAPLWLAELLSSLEIFPRSFSKYGQCYKNELIEKYFDGVMVIA